MIDEQDSTHEINVLRHFAYDNEDEKVLNIISSMTFKEYDVGRLYTMRLPPGYRSKVYYYKFIEDSIEKLSSAPVNNGGRVVVNYADTYTSVAKHYLLKNAVGSLAHFRPESRKCDKREVILMGLNNDCTDVLRRCNNTMFYHYKWYKFLIDSKYVGYLPSPACESLNLIV